MPDETKSIQIKGGAMEDYLRTGTRKRKSKNLAPSHRAESQKDSQTGGFDLPPPAPLAAQQSGLAPSPVASTGGAAEKLVLLEKKKKTSSVILTRKDPRKKRLAGQIGQTRKLRIHMGGLRTRMTRAKDIHAKSEKEAISKIVETLHGAGLIKGGGKEPSSEKEKVLRGIYRDYLQLRSNAL
jgi:hypothetical protein